MLSFAKKYAKGIVSLRGLSTCYTLQVRELQVKIQLVHLGV